MTAAASSVELGYTLVPTWFRVIRLVMTLPYLPHLLGIGAEDHIRQMDYHLSSPPQGAYLLLQSDITPSPPLAVCLSLRTHTPFWGLVCGPTVYKTGAMVYDNPVLKTFHVVLKFQDP